MKNESQSALLRPLHLRITAWASIPDSRLACLNPLIRGLSFHTDRVLAVAGRVYRVSIRPIEKFNKGIFHAAPSMYFYRARTC